MAYMITGTEVVAYQDTQSPQPTIRHSECDFIIRDSDGDIDAGAVSHTYSASYLVVPTFDISTCDDVLLPRAGSTGAIKF